MRAIFRVPERHAFCIFLSTPLASLPTSFCRMTSKSLDHPPSTSKMILHWLISYPGYLCFNSHLSGAYFMFFSEVFLSRLLTQGQLISKAITCLSLSRLTILASTLFALSSYYCCLLLLDRCSSLACILHSLFDSLTLRVRGVRESVSSE